MCSSTSERCCLSKAADAVSEICGRQTVQRPHRRHSTNRAEPRRARALDRLHRQPCLQEQLCLAFRVVRGEGRLSCGHPDPAKYLDVPVSCSCEDSRVNREQRMRYVLYRSRLAIRYIYLHMSPGLYGRLRSAHRLRTFSLAASLRSHSGSWESPRTTSKSTYK